MTTNFGMSTHVGLPWSLTGPSGFNIQAFSSLNIQGFTIQDLSIQGFSIQGFSIQGFSIQGLASKA